MTGVCSTTSKPFDNESEFRNGNKATKIIPHNFRGVISISKVGLVVKGPIVYALVFHICIEKEFEYLSAQYSCPYSGAINK